MRPSWDDYFMAMAYLASTRATCLRRRVGAVLVKDRRVLATGYNGAPNGIRHCEETGCIRENLNIPSGERHELCRGLHAEQNAIIQAALHGTSIKDSVIYVTNHPCVVCAKMIINAGIKEIVYDEGYADDLSKSILSESKINIRQHTLNTTVIKEILEI
jgi:dCMP deaminase